MTDRWKQKLGLCAAGLTVWEEKCNTKYIIVSHNRISKSVLLENEAGDWQIFSDNRVFLVDPCFGALPVGAFFFFDEERYLKLSINNALCLDDLGPNPSCAEVASKIIPFAPDSPVSNKV